MMITAYGCRTCCLRQMCDDDNFLHRSANSSRESNHLGPGCAIDARSVVVPRRRWTLWWILHRLGADA